MEGNSIYKPDDILPSGLIRNLVYLAENITNLEKILLYLIENRIISQNEYQTIKSEKTDLERNSTLLQLIEKKGWSKNKKLFLEILRQTSNECCADKIEGLQTKESKFGENKKLNTKWWPVQLVLPLAFHERKSENHVLTRKLKDMLQDASKTTVITQKITVSGLGGIGKTTTAIWFAIQYEKDYDYIIWIDCGEQSLLNSFRKLARDLNVKHVSELELKDLALDSFKILNNCKCLFIFDNAECYIGREGIREVLPKFNDKFDVLITSRNKDWGNANGDGKIPQLQMNVFEQIEGEEFMKKNINDLLPDQFSCIEILCNLLGNLPLALQIAVATLNRQNHINLPNYIERIRSYPDVLHLQFDNYEKTIHQTMKISLDLIKNYESNDETNIGKIAYEILMIFGFITPDDVQSDFFMAVTRSSNIYDVGYAMELLERYSLLSQKNYVGSQNTFSIHRLLQQVIRHNSKEEHEQILDKILSCQGFLAYKLLPFSFADEGLQNKFPEIRAELIDKLKLIDMLKSRNFADAVLLSRVISNTLKDISSQFNFAVCLKHNSEFRQSEKVFQKLLSLASNAANEPIPTFENYFTQWGTIKSDPPLSKNVVMGQLFSIYLIERNAAQAKKAVSCLKQLILPIIRHNDLLDFLDLKYFSNVTLHFNLEDCYITLQVEETNVLTKKLELHSWYIDEDTRIPHELEDFNLTDCEIAFSYNGYLPFAKNVTLRRLTFYRLPTEQLFMDPPPSLNKIFVDVEPIQKLTLENMNIDLVCTPSILHQFTLKNVRVYGWNTANSIVTTFCSQNFALTQRTKLTITNMDLQHCSLDITILPNSLIKLRLNECFLINCFTSSSAKANLMPVLLQELTLLNVYVEGKHGEQCTAFDVSNLIPQTLNKLTIKDFHCKCSCLLIPLNCLTTIRYLHLEECTLEIFPNMCISPIELELKDMRIVAGFNNALDRNPWVIQFVDITTLRHLRLTQMTIEFNFSNDIVELNLINPDGGIHRLKIDPNPGNTQIRINQLQILHEAGNDENYSNVEMKKYKLLTFLKSISGSKTIAGLYASKIINKKGGIRTVEKLTRGCLPGILTTEMPKYSAKVDEWQTFIDESICDWRNRYLVHIRWFPDEHPLHDILKDKDDVSWNDLIEEGGGRNTLWKKCLDKLAIFLRQLENAGVVPVVDLLPGINSKKYGWAGRGGLKGSSQLYQITKDYLPQHHNLKSLIWVWSLHVDILGLSRIEDYWPGNQHVDVVSVYFEEKLVLNNPEYPNLLDVVGDTIISMEGMYKVPSTSILDSQSRWSWFTAHANYLPLQNGQNIENTFKSSSVINRTNNPFFSI